MSRAHGSEQVSGVATRSQPPAGAAKVPPDAAVVQAVLQQFRLPAARAEEAAVQQAAGEVLTALERFRELKPDADSDATAASH